LSGKPRRKRSRVTPAWLFRSLNWRGIGVAITTAVVMASLFTFQLLPDRVTLKVGQIATREVVAHRYIRYPDEAETARLRTLAAGSVEPIYAKVADAAPQLDRDVTAFFDRLQNLRSASRPGSRQATPEESLADARRVAPPGISDRTLRTLVRMSPSQLARVPEAARRAALDTMSAPIRDRPDDLPRVAEQLPERLSGSGFSSAEREVIAAVVARYLRPNRILDETATEEARARERDSVHTVYHEINRGEVVIPRGVRVTPEHMRKFVHLGLQHPKADALTAVNLTLLAIGLVGLFALYLRQFHPRILGDLGSVVLIAVIATGSLLLFRLGSDALDLRLSGEQTGYVGMMSAALAAMLVAALLNQQVAVFTGICLSLATAVLVENQLKFAIIAFVSSLVGVTAVANIRDRAGILRAALTVAAANVGVIMVAQGATGGDWRAELGPASAWGIMGGVGSVFLFVPAAALLERPFRRTTHLTLLELSDPNSPLLKRLSMEAPGTYAHSIIVGNLSEAAAKAIGADGLFARVAACYHDIGKVVRPQFFVENQSQASENLHAGMSASLSCLVVTSHVRDGVELAEKHRLPPPIIDIIKEHHGTCLIKYFYHQAVTSGGEDSAPALEYQFRYEGPRPQTKESGIIMLADAAEAASRSLDKPTPGRIRDLVETLVRDRLADGQLDDCELTFKDLEKIIATFTRSLSSLLHARVEYPTLETRELTRLTPDASPGKELVATGKALADYPAPGAGAYPDPPRN
jgi:putative nucleotidyltransferase with HDIG domain